MKRLRLLTFVNLSLLSVIGAGCGTAMLSDEHLAKQAKSQFSQMKKSEKLSNNASHKAMVNRIGKRITGVAQVDLPGTEWEFVVFDKKEANAFAMPGGKVGVYTGLITLANGNEDEVAAVIGHEVAHVALRHSNKRMSQAIGIGLGGVILETAMRNKSDTDRLLARGAYGAGTTVGLALPYSRSNEREADHRGLYYSAMAGYDPRAAVSFWKKMVKASGGGKVPEFLSTHPDSENRIKFLESHMDHAMALYRQAKQARGEKPNP